MKQKVLDYLTLFTSMSTLICCALPALLVTIGLGAAMAGFLGNHPELIWVSENKGVLFLVAGVLMFTNGALIYKNRNAPCVSKECESSRKTSKWVYFVSLGIYVVGVSFAYILPYI